MIQTQKEVSLSYSNKTIQQSIQPQNQRVLQCCVKYRFSFFILTKRKTTTTKHQTNKHSNKEERRRGMLHHSYPI
jgi:hypothetical protein